MKNLVIVAILFCWSGAAAADIIEWQDADGVRHYTNLKGEVPKEEEGSARVVVDEFTAGKTMRKLAGVNADIVARRIPASPTSEQYNLFRRYIDSRHGAGGMADMSVLDYAMMVEDSIIDTFLTEYRQRPANVPAGSKPGSARVVLFGHLHKPS